MIKRVILVLTMVTLSAILNPIKASAATYFVDYAVTGTGPCSNTDYTFPITISWNVPAETLTATIIETENGVTSVNADFVSNFTGSNTVPGIGMNFGSFNFPQPYTFTITIKFSTPNLGNFSSWIFQGTCSGGVVTATVSKLPLGAAAVQAGPQIPDGYVLKTITCTQYVFDSPGGNPVGENKVTEGQTFYVSPKSVKGADGRMWSQVFVSSYSNPWILTSCAK